MTTMLQRILTAAFLTSLPAALMAQAQVDEALPVYEKTSGVSGNLSSVGSDTLANLMTLWAEGFKRVYPNVNIQIQAAGSSTAPPGLTEGTSNLGPMSRLMKDNEIQAFEQRHGYKPTPVAVAIDALAVFVHKDNPISGLTLQQTDGIFSSTHTCGGQDIVKWGQLGLTGAWTSRGIQLYGRNSVSGTYGYFKQHALCKGDFKNTVNEQPGSASVVQSVSASLNGIGYSGIGYDFLGARDTPGRRTGRAIRRSDSGKCDQRQLSARPLSLRLCQQGTGQGPRPHYPAVPHHGPVTAGSASRGQGRLHTIAGNGRGAGTGQDSVRRKANHTNRPGWPRGGSFVPGPGANQFRSRTVTHLSHL